MKPSKSLKSQALLILKLLTLQYILGLYVNMFVQFPDHKTESQLWEFAWTQIPLAAHILVGFALGISAIVLLVRAVKSHDQHWITAASFGLGAIILAGLGGSGFIPTQTDAFSYLMGLSFLLAVFAYGWGLYKDAPRRAQS